MQLKISLNCRVIRGFIDKNIFKSILFVAVFSGVCLNCFPQNKRNAVVLEIAGKSFSYYDISYERYLNEKLHIGLGIGLERISKVLTITGYEKEAELKLPVYAGYTFGKRKHHVMTEAGVSFDMNYFGGKFLTTDVWPFVSCGYEFRGEKFIIRIPVYLVYVGTNAWWPAVLPWAGLSVGVPF